MAHSLDKQHDTQTSMKYLRKSKADTSPKHRDGVHMEIKCTATEKFRLHCQSMEFVFCGVFLFAFIPCLRLVPLFEQLVWASLPGHKEVLQAG